MSEPLVIIGNGMAAVRLVDELSKRSLGRHAIAVIGDESRLAYNRVLLSSVLAGEIAPDEIELKTAAWWRDRGVTLLYGRRATSVDARARVVGLADGASLSFAKLVFATGSRSIRPPLPGMDLDGVLTFRNADDAAMIAGAAGGGARRPGSAAAPPSPAAPRPPGRRRANCRPGSPSASPAGARR